MRHLVKFLHTMGAIGLMGAMVSLIVLFSFLPEPAVVAESARMRAGMGGNAEWVFLPSMALTLIGGLLAFAVNRAYQDAGWALATGIIIFEWGFVAVVGPMQNEALLAARALAGEFDPAGLGKTLSAERNSLWVMFDVASANVVLGVWRPRFVWLKSAVMARD